MRSVWEVAALGLGVLLATIALGAIALGIGGCSALRSLSPRAGMGLPAPGPVPIAPDDVVFGVPNAPVTAVVFLDYRDPGAPRTMRVVERVRQKMPTDLRYVVKPLSSCGYQHSRETARAAAAVLELAGPSAFWSFQQAVLEYWPRVSPAFLRSAARDAGLSEAQVAQLEDARFEARIERNRRLAKGLDSDYAPTLFLNGVRLDGWITEKELREKLSAELRPAREAKLQTQSDALAYERRVEANAKDWEKPESKERPDPSLYPDPTLYAVPVGDSPVDGPAQAPVTLVQFADFTSDCSKNVQPALARMREKYGDQLRIVFKHFNWWGHNGDNFVQYARERGGDAKFFEAERLLWETAPELSFTALERLAQRLGLDPQEALQAVSSERYRERIERDLALAFDLNVHWEPSLFVNGRFLTDEQIGELEPVIEERLQAAKALLASGTPPERLYETILASASPPVQPKVVPLPVPASLPYRGEADAPIVVQVFTSYRRAACSGTLGIERIQIRHPRQIKLVFWPLPEAVGEPMSEPDWRASEAALEAHAQLGNAGFWHMAKGLCRSPVSPSDEDLASFAEQINLDGARFRAALADHRHRPQIEAARAVAKSRGIKYSRGFVVNGLTLPGRHLDFNLRRRITELLPAAPVPAAAAASEEPAP